MVFRVGVALAVVAFTACGAPEVDRLDTGDPPVAREARWPGMVTIAPLEPPTATADDWALSTPRLMAAATGALPKGIIRDRVRQTMPRIKDCYDQRLADEPGFGAATVLIVFEIGPDGRVAHTEAAEWGHPLLERCVTEAIASVRFPEPDRGVPVSVRYPFRFRPTAAERVENVGLEPN